MTSLVNIDIPAILQMAMLATVVALLLPIDRLTQLKGVPEWRLGLLRTACGITFAVASWSTIQVVAGTFVERPQQQFQVPIVVLPQQGQPFGGMPGVPGRDI